MRSIKQNLAAQPLPDFRNAGVILRILLGVNLLALAAALVQGQGVDECVQRYMEMAVWVQPLLLANVACLAWLDGALRRLAVWPGRLLVVCLAAVSAVGFVELWAAAGFDAGGAQRLLRAGLLAGSAAAALLWYFAQRSSVLSPALVEARLQALSAGIRPHFLFNSLNAVLALIRVDHQRAETALEELAELFRALMRDHREMVPLADEIALCRQYLDLETLRLGERLRVEWELHDIPERLNVPPLMMQPLIENAVYHGIEPGSTPGTIRIRLARQSDELHIELVNPCHADGDHQRGNRMALENIGERLSLYYDLEARLETGEVVLADGAREYRVHIVLPCRGERT